MDKNFWQNKRVFISGADGFIGSSFRQALKLEGALVSGASLSSAYPLDILNTEDLKKFFQKEKFDVFIHCAALDGNAKFKEESANQIFDANIALADSVLSALIVSDVTDIILVSSAEVYKILNKSEINENNKSYAAAKLTIEKKFSDFAISYHKHLMIARASNVYGPGEHRPEGMERVIPAMIRKAFSGEDIEIWGDGREIRNFLHIKDLVSSVILAAQKNYFKTFYISGPDSISIKKLAKSIISLTNSSSRIIFKGVLNQAAYFPNENDRPDIRFRCRSLYSGLKEMINNRNLLVALADKNFVVQAKQLFSSVYNNAGWQGDYMLLSYGLEASDKDWFKERGILVFDCPSRSELGGAQKYPAVTMSKLLLFQEYFKSWRRIVFLDSDIIVRASLDGLLKVKGFAAPKGDRISLKDEFDFEENNSANMFASYDLNSKAFCSGVFVFETKIIKTDTFLTLERLTDEFGPYSVFGEEPILNLYFYKNWLQLGKQYHTVPWYFKYPIWANEKNIKGRILHFLCFDKPWQTDNFFFPEWQNNFQLAEKINLWRRPATKLFYGWNLFLFYIAVLKIYRRLDFSPVFLMFKNIDKNIGLCGLWLNKRCPALYRVMKRLFLIKKIWQK